MGFGEAVRKGVDLNDNQVNIGGHDPLLALIVNGEGYSFNPLKVLSGYRANMLRKFIRHGKDVMETPERNGKTSIRNRKFVLQRLGRQYQEYYLL